MGGGRPCLHRDEVAAFPELTQVFAQGWADADSVEFGALDRAGWHTSPKVVWPSNITPLFLPPYSPELNGIERLWPRVRVKGLANRSLPDGAALDAEGVNAWNRLTIDEIKSTCRTPWLERRC